MVERISGKSQPSAIHHLVNNNKIEQLKGKANTLSSTVSFNSLHKHCSKRFKESRVQQKKRPLNFQSDNLKYYHELFSLSELQDALRQSNNTVIRPQTCQNTLPNAQTPTRHCYILTASYLQ
jgi:hypothetical protein